MYVECSRRKPLCHPERKHYAFGLCASCYNMKRRHENPQTRRRKLEWERGYRLRHPEKRTRATRKHLYKTQYGITLEDFDALSEQQRGLCTICAVKPDKVLQVDHCHDTGRVRGLLCGGCNLLAAHLERNTLETIEAALKYLGRNTRCT